MIIGNPVSGQIYLTPSGSRLYRSQRFGCDGFPREQQLGACPHFHRAIDVAPSDGRAGVDLLAVAAGRVFTVAPLNDGAKVVGVDHGDGYVSGYAHNASNLVAVGQQVSKGQHIAEMGATGNATGNHVHLILKGDFVPSGNLLADLNDLILDDPKYGFSGIEPGRPHGTGRGTWIDPWPRLEQNVTVRAKGPGVNLRASAGSGSTLGSAYAHTADDGHVRRDGDDADLGLTATMRKWGGIVLGASVTQGGVTSSRWEKVLVGGTYYYLWSPLAIRSVS